MAAPMWKAALDEFVQSEVDGTAPTIAKLLCEDTLSLLDFVEGLGKYLTSEETFVRGRVVKLLSNVLHLLPADKLSSTEIELLVAYLCDRLKDHHSIQPATLHGQLALSQARHIPDGCAERICRSVFSEVQTQTLAQTDRRTVYSIFTVLLATKLPEMTAMGSDFVYGYIQAMDAEKDPRNLVMAFRCAKVIISNIPLGVFVEEMFEVVSCYFPIDFTPPPGDPHGITKDDLILGLRGCLAATGQFGQFCCPLLLEKLSSDVTSAKVDALRTLEAAAGVYGPKCLLEYRTSLFNCIKREVFGSGNDELETSALSALTAMATTFSQDEIITDNQTCYEEFVTEVWNECSRYLGDDSLRLMVPTCRLLVAMAAGSDVSCCTVLSLVMPRLLQIFHSHPLASERRPTMESILSFLRITRQFQSDKVKKTFSDVQTSVYAIILAALSESSVQLRVTAVQCCNALLQLPSSLSTEHREVIAKILVMRIFSDEDQDVRVMCCEALSTLTTVDTPTVLSIVLPCLLERLTTKAMDTTPPTHHHMVYTALAAITVTMETLTPVVKALVTYLSYLAQASGEETDLLSLTSCLATIMMSSVTKSDMLAFLHDEILPELFNLLVTMVTDTGHHDSCVHSEEVLVHLTTCVCQVTIHLKKMKLTELYRSVTKLYLHNDTAYLTSTPTTPFCPLQISSPWQQTELVTIATPVICCCPVLVLEPDLLEYGQRLSSLSLHTDHSFTRTSSNKCLAAVINKWPPGESLHTFLQSTCHTISTVLQTDSGERKTSALSQLIWVTKALAMRGHAKSNETITMLTDLLEDSCLGEQAAAGFKIILGDFPDVLSKPLGANIKMMYKQKIFVENVAKLQEGFTKSDSSTKKNYLFCLSHMLKVLPRQVLLTELPPLFPLMVHSLVCDDLDLQLSTMSILCDLTHDAPDVISRHVDAILPQLLKLCTYQPSMKMRIKALQCIGEMVVLPGHLLLPYQQRVVRGLEAVLDDRKRLVRNEAVTARSEWFLVGTSSK